MIDELEKQWKEEAESSFNEQDDGTGYYGGDVNYITGYVAGRKAAQEEISFWKKEYVSHSETMLNCQKEIDSLKSREQKLIQIIKESLSHLSTSYSWGLHLYEDENYQEMEDEDEKDNMKDDLDIVCDYINNSRQVLSDLGVELC